MTKRAYEPFRALRGVRNAILLLVAVVVVGTAGYMVLEGWGFLDAFYMTIISITTAGYNEVRQLDTVGRLWTMFVLVSGVGILFYSIVAFVELAVEGTVQRYLGRRRMDARISKLRDHYVLCGYGRVGRQVAEELSEEGVSFVVIEKDTKNADECAERGYLEILGDASEDEVLEAANVGRAKALITALDSDAANVFITLSARKMNPGLFIVSRADSDGSAAKLEIAGADRTLSPYSVGGRRLASLATRPSVVDFLDVVSRGNHNIEFRLEEFSIDDGSPLAGHTIGEIDVFGRSGARILAIIREGREFTTNPTAEDSIFSGDILILLGTPEQIEKLQALVEK
ncbi:MAG: potassium channel protein [Rubrobacteraceae bacterium]